MCGPNFCSMKISQDVRDYAAEQGVTEGEALKKGMLENSVEFVSKGAAITIGISYPGGKLSTGLFTPRPPLFSTWV